MCQEDVNFLVAVALMLLWNAGLTASIIEYSEEISLFILATALLAIRDYL